MFGLHTVPFLTAVAIGVTLCVLILLTATRYRNDQVKAAATAGMTLVAFIFTSVDVIHHERFYDTRDTLVRVKLLAGDVNMTGLEGWIQDRVVVEKGDCTASYVIQPDSQLNQTDVWPLVPGTGRVISGSCNGTQLDELFVTAS